MFAADKVGFDTIKVYAGEAASMITPLVLAKNVEYATHGFAVAEEKEFTRKDVRILRPPVYSGPALMFNLDKLPEFQDVRARRAVAHAIDRSANGTVALGESGVGVKSMVGFSDILVPDWLTEEERGKLDPYELDLDKAGQLLTKAGWRRQGAGWLKPDGSPARYELIYPAEWADWSTSGDNLARQLTDFGITVKGRGISATQQPIDVDKGAFELAIQAWGSGGHPHPHFSFVMVLFTHNIPVAANQGGKGMAFDATRWGGHAHRTDHAVVLDGADQAVGVRGDRGEPGEGRVEQLHVLGTRTLLRAVHGGGAVRAEQRVVHVARDDELDAVDLDEPRRVDLFETAEGGPAERQLLSLRVQEADAERLHHAGAAVGGGAAPEPEHDPPGAPPYGMGDQLAGAVAGRGERRELDIAARGRVRPGGRPLGDRQPPQP